MSKQADDIGKKRKTFVEQGIDVSKFKQVESTWLKSMMAKSKITIHVYMATIFSKPYNEMRLIKAKCSAFHYKNRSRWDSMSYTSGWKRTSQKDAKLQSSADVAGVLLIFKHSVPWIDFNCFVSRPDNICYCSRRIWPTEEIKSHFLQAICVGWTHWF